MDHDDDHQHNANGTADSAKHSHRHYAQGRGSDADGRRRVEVITGLDRRRRWSRELKARITAESFAPGANVSKVARLHGVGLGLLHYWRRCAREGVSDSSLQFVPVVAESDPNPAQVSHASSGAIEIEFDGVRIWVRAPVDVVALRAVMAAVRAET
jgi:transposase